MDMTFELMFESASKSQSKVDGRCEQDLSTVSAAAAAPAEARKFSTCTTLLSPLHHHPQTHTTLTPFITCMPLSREELSTAPETTRVEKKAHTHFNHHCQAAGRHSIDKHQRYKMN
jgi:hypothetical protein